MKQISKALVGRRVRLVRFNDRYTKLDPGVTGTVDLVDDMGTVHVTWDSGERLGLCWDDGDRWTVLPEGK